MVGPFENGVVVLPPVAYFHSTAVQPDFLAGPAVTPIPENLRKP